MSTKIFDCPKCGTRLVGPEETPKPSDTLECPIHGIVGTVEQLAGRAGRGVRDAVQRTAETTRIKSKSK
jgi:hypothetical protein